MQVTTNTSYTIEYQINGTEEGQWKEIASGETIGELLDGNVVNVRLTDGNNVGQMISKTIEDNIAPKVVVAGGGTTSNSVKVVVTAEDGESGMISSPTYTYYKRKCRRRRRIRSTKWSNRNRRKHIYIYRTKARNKL